MLIGWADSFRHVELTREVNVNDGNAKTGAAASDFDYYSDYSSQNNSASQSNGAVGQSLRVTARTVAEWNTDCIICGVSSFDVGHVAILGYFPESPGGSSSKEWDDDYDCAAPPQWPELQIVNRRTGELISADTVEIRNSSVENTSPNDFFLLSNYQNMSRAQDYIKWNLNQACLSRGGSRGLSPTLFVVTGLDIVVARVRDTIDRIEAALAAKDVKLAVDLAYADKNSLRLNQMDELISLYLEILFQQDRIEDAAQECKRLFDKDRALWEKWILIFAKRNRLSAVAPFIPTGAPRLTPSIYEVILSIHSNMLMLLNSCRLY